MKQFLSAINSGRYSKFLVAIVGAVATTITTYFPVTDHWTTIVTSALSAILVYFVPNTTVTGSLQESARGNGRWDRAIVKVGRFPRTLVFQEEICGPLAGHGSSLQSA